MRRQYCYAISYRSLFFHQNQKRSLLDPKSTSVPRIDRAEKRRFFGLSTLIFAERLGAMTPVPLALMRTSVDLQATTCERCLLRCSRISSGVASDINARGGGEVVLRTIHSLSEQPGKVARTQTTITIEDNRNCRSYLFVLSELSQSREAAKDRSRTLCESSPISSGVVEAA